MTDRFGSAPVDLAPVIAAVNELEKTVRLGLAMVSLLLTADRVQTPADRKEYEAVLQTIRDQFT
jgi:hypothetical protein